MQITWLQLQKSVVWFFTLLLFSTKPIQAGFPAGTRIATPDFTLPLKFEKACEMQNLFKPRTSHQTTIAYPAPQEELSFFSVFKSTQDAKNYTAGDPYEYSASFKEFLQAYDIDVALQTKRGLDATIARTISDTLHDMYATQQHFGHFYEVDHLNAITTTLIKTILSNWSLQHSPHHRSKTVITQLLEVAQGFQRAGEQIGQYRAQSGNAHLYTPEAVSHAIHNVFKPFKKNAHRVIAYPSTLPSALTQTLTILSSALQRFYAAQDPDAQALTKECQKALALLEEEELFIADAAKAASQNIPVVTPLIMLKHQIGNAAAVPVSQEPGYTPATIITQGKNKPFNQQLAIIDPTTGAPQDTPEPIENFVHGNIIILNSSTTAGRELFHTKQAVLDLITAYQTMLFDLSPRAQSIDAEKAKSLSIAFPSWTTATMLDTGFVHLTTYTYHLASYNAGKRTWHFVLDRATETIDRTHPIVNSFVQEEEQRELTSLHLFKNSWPDEVHLALRIDWTRQPDNLTGRSGRAQQLHVHDKLNTPIGPKIFSFAAIDRMVTDKIPIPPGSDNLPVPQGRMLTPFFDHETWLLAADDEQFKKFVTTLEQTLAHMMILLAQDAYATAKNPLPTAGIIVAGAACNPYLPPTPYVATAPKSRRYPGHSASSQPRRAAGGVGKVRSVAL